MPRLFAATALLVAVAVASVCWGDAPGDSAAAADGARVVVLDTVGGIWRMYATLQPPVVREADGGTRPLLFNVAWLDSETLPPPADWTRPEMDDRRWMRGPARRAARTPYLARLSLRGKFEVADPGRVKGLSLSVDYYGGTIVCVNGKEVGRSHVPAEADAGQVLAEPYPLEAFVLADGELLHEFPRWGIKSDPARVRLRTRTQKVDIPRGLLRKGLNVIGIDIVRAAYDPVVEEKKDKRTGYILSWNTCELRRAQLTASSVEGLIPNATRPPGLQVWNADTLSGDVDTEFGDRTEPIRPIALSGVRNGTFTGKVLVGRDKPIRELKATASDLRSGASVIPAAQVSFLYGIPWGSEIFPRNSREGLALRPYPQGVAFLNAMLPDPPEEVSVPTKRARERLAPGQAKPLLGAVAPIWVRVRVPRDARPGDYRGTVTIRVADESPVSVPVQLKVLPWALPDPQEFRTWVELIQSPDTLAVEYDLPLWSQEHFAMIARSFDLVSPTGTRIVYVPAIAHTNHGNAESMIRWIKKSDGGYGWDFSVMEKYLDTAQKHLGTPKIVCLQVWEVYMSSRASAGRRFGEKLAEQQKVSGGAPLVTLLDPVTGKTENATLPKLSDPASKPLWQALVAQVRARLRKRGLEKALMLGMFTDSTPSKEDTQLFLDIAPDLAWVQQGHNVFKNLHGMAKVGYTATWWSGHFADDSIHRRSDTRSKTRVMQSMHGWKQPRLDALYERTGRLESYPPTRWRFECETAITTDIMRGIGRLGADFWKPVKNKEGRRAGYVHDRFPDGQWRAVGHDISSWVLEPHPTGPVTTNRLLALVDGVQECEARIFIEQALTDEGLRARLGDDLARRCQETLNERLAYMWKCLAHLQLELHGWGITSWRFSPGVAGHAWFLSTGHEERTEKLYALAAEVAGKLGTASPEAGERSAPGDE